jgi:hypothetical protein
MKKATQVGIARTLNNAPIRKAGFIPSRMVRGYGKIIYGYRIIKSDNNFIVRYDNPADRVPTLGRTEEQIAADKEAATVRFNMALDRIHGVLTAKGYHAAIEDGSVKVYNANEEEVN